MGWYNCEDAGGLVRDGLNQQGSDQDGLSRESLNSKFCFVFNHEKNTTQLCMTLTITATIKACMTMIKQGHPRQQKDILLVVLGADLGDLL